MKYTLLGLIACTVLTTTPLSAAVVLYIDVADPAAVTITSTTANAQNDGSGAPDDGLTLVGFFTANTQVIDENIGDIASGNFTVLDQDVQNGTRKAFQYVFADSFQGGFTLNDLNFYADFDSGDYFARTDTRAVEGSVTINLSAYAASLPSIGDSGNLILATPDAPVVVGQWQVIPEPASLALFGMGGLALLRRRRAA